MALLSRYADQQNTTSSCIVGRVQKAEWQLQRSTFTHTTCGHDAICLIIMVRSFCKRIYSPYARKSKHHLTLKTKRSSDDLLLIQLHTHMIMIIIIVTLKITLAFIALSEHSWFVFFFSPCIKAICNITMNQMMYTRVYKTNEQEVGRSLLVVQSRHLSYAQHTSNLVATLWSTDDSSLIESDNCWLVNCASNSKSHLSLSFHSFPQNK